MSNLSALRNAGLTDEESELIAAGVQRIEAKALRNLVRSRYYDGKQRVKNLGIAVPPPLATIETVVGWPSTVVDSLEERLDIDSFDVVDADVDSLGIDEWWMANNGPVDSGMAILDSLIYGVTFAAISPGGPGEPDQLLTIEPATTMTGAWNARRRRLTSAVHAGWSLDGQLSNVTLWTDTHVVECEFDPQGGWQVTKYLHGLDRPPVVPLINKPRTGRPWGSSEISRAVMGYTDAAVRTLLGMEVAREFYSSPQRWIMGADEESFQDQNGNPLPAWEAYLGRFLALSKKDGEENPQVGQFTASSPAPYVEQVKLLAELLAAEGAMPVTYLGFHTQNPPGGDGIRAQETRLVKRAERRQRVLGGAFAELVRLMLLMRDGSAPTRIVTRWRDPSTPTKAATADAVSKYVAAGVLYPDSDVTREMIGFDTLTRQRLADEDRRRRSRAMTEALASAAGRLSNMPAAVEDADDGRDR